VEDFHSEEQQVEAIKRFWHDNGNSIIAGLVIGLSAFVGFNYYKDVKLEAELAASTAYLELQKTAASAPTEFVTNAQQYIVNHQDSSYVSLTALALAKDAVSHADWSAAEKHLNTAIEKSTDDGIKAIAVLRLARVQIQNEQIDNALTTLSQPLPEAFTANVEETKGDAYLLQGKKELARNSYQVALATITAGTNPNLQMKVDDLAQIITLTN
jgi:predicted negative regulator of RcsB-dependent stress response